jgi:tetratricopeptide (TPR) repeat protein
MKKHITIIIILFTILGYSQESKTKELLVNGNNAFQKNDFENARKYYSEIIKIDSINKDAIFNLAITELNLGNKNKSCELLQKSYKLQDTGVAKLIKEHCGEIEYNENMFYQDTDEMPKFKIDNDVYDLITDKGINPILFDKLNARAKESKVLRKIKGQKIFVIFKIDKNGNFDSRTTGKNTSKEIDNEMKEIFREIAEYIPCQYQNKNVGMWNGFALPINLK